MRYLQYMDGADKDRSALRQRVARANLARLEKDGRDRRDIEIINRNADRLNREALDSLEYQRLPFPGESRFCSQKRTSC